MDSSYPDKKRTYNAKWNAANPDKVRAYSRKSAKKRYKANRDSARAAARRQIFIRRYGITPEQRDEMLEQQGGVCAICAKDQHRGVNWHTDHCHKTKRVRGILCRPCNIMLGHIKDDVAVLKAAVDYLTK